MKNNSREEYHSIIRHYESCFDTHGDTYLGVDWPNERDVLTRYQVMLDVIRRLPGGGNVSLLDFGCGTAALLGYIRQHQLQHINYSGLDASEKYIAFSREKFPDVVFYRKDILQEHDLPEFDYIVMNGVFTEKRELSFDAMFAYFKKMIAAVFQHTGKGIAFNVMSKHVDWERDDLFHLPFDALAAFLKKEISRNFIIRNDYGLYEYTTYVYK